MIPLESVEEMLGEATEGEKTEEKKAVASAVPPPLSAPFIPATPAPVPTTGISRLHFSDMLRPDGTVDTEAVYRFGKVPDVKLSAELVLQALMSLPPDLPELARHAALQITVNSLTQAAGIPVETVISDAHVRHTRLSQFRDALRSEMNREQQPLLQSISELEALIAAKQNELVSARAELQGRESKSVVTYQDLDSKLSALQEVIDLMEAKPPEEGESASEDEPLPVPLV